MNHLNIRDKILMTGIRGMSGGKNKLDHIDSEIVVFRSAALGDFVISIPAFVFLKRLYPDKRIILVTTQSTVKSQRQKVLNYTTETDKIPWVDFIKGTVIDEVYILESLKIAFSELRSVFKNRKIGALFLFTEPCAPKMGVAKKVLFFRLMGIKAPIYGWRDYGTNEYKRTEQVKEGMFYHHVLGSIASVLEIPQCRNMNTVTIEFRLKLTDEAKAFADNLWKEKSLNNRRVIALSPGAVQLHKKWPEESYTELVRHILKDPNNCIIITGTKNDKEICNKIVTASVREDHSNPEQIVDICGGTTVMQLAAVLEKCDLLVGNDGGTMHVGDALGIPVISICPGLEWPDSIEPWHNVQLALRQPVECFPCYSFVTCPRNDNQCMKQITVQEVINRVDAVISGIIRPDKYNSRKMKIIRTPEGIHFEEIK